MKKIILLTFSFLIFSCNTPTAKTNSLEWSDDGKDFIFKQCISWGLSAGNMTVDKANEYCYCTLDIIIENFDNAQDVIDKMLLDRSLMLLYEGCKYP